VIWRSPANTPSRPISTIRPWGSCLFSIPATAPGYDPGTGNAYVIRNLSMNDIPQPNWTDVMPTSDLTAVDNSDGSIDLSWQNNSVNATSYDVWGSADGENWTWIASVSSRTSYTVPAGTASDSTYFDVVADPPGSQYADQKLDPSTGSATQPFPTSQPVTTDPTAEGYPKIKITQKTDLVSTVRVTGDSVQITAEKGPMCNDDIADQGRDPERFVEILDGSYDQGDHDSLQVVVLSQDANGKKLTSCNSALGDKGKIDLIGRTKAAVWTGVPGNATNAAYTQLGLIKNAVKIRILCMYTDVIRGPEDAAAVTASWTAAYDPKNGWNFTKGEKVGFQQPFRAGKAAAWKAIANMVNTATDGGCALVHRCFEGQVYNDSGFDIIPSEDLKAVISGGRVDTQP